MVGIYKITSPTGRVYIGQSWFLEKRERTYKNTKKAGGQPKVQSSILKHGWGAHLFEVIHELPSDVTQEVMNTYEQLYMDQYRECGARMMNICIIAISRKGIKSDKPSAFKGKKHTEETKKIIREKRALQKNVTPPPKGPAWNKGKTGILGCGQRAGFKLSEETKQKVRDANLGKKLTPETIAKRTATMKENLKTTPRKQWSEESRKKQSERYKGKPSPKKGIKQNLTEEQRMKIGDRNRGRKQPQEEKDKRTASIKAAWEKKKGGTPS